MQKYEPAISRVLQTLHGGTGDSSPGSEKRAVSEASAMLMNPVYGFRASMQEKSYGKSAITKCVESLYGCPCQIAAWNLRNGIA